MHRWPATLALCALVACARTQAGPADEPCRPVQGPPALSFAAPPMDPLCEGVGAERGLTGDQQDQLRRAYGEARRALTAALGELRGPAPLTLFCHSAACKVGFGAAPESAAATDLGFARDGVETRTGYEARSSVIVTGPVARTARILTHEFVHAEMKAWLPYDSMPTWFNEGVATYVAGEPDCSALPGSASFDVAALDTKEHWQAHIRQRGKSIPTYCQARERVAAWAERAGGPQRVGAALRSLLSAVAAGEPFQRAFSR
jgi:hypothetical protein